MCLACNRLVGWLSMQNACFSGTKWGTLDAGQLPISVKWLFYALSTFQRDSGQ